MRVEIYLDEGKVARTKIETEENENEEEMMKIVAGNLLNQIKETGFSCIPENDGYRMINAYNIDEIRIVPDGK